jgi:NAD(P)-dependent dehydrogenase (short-subunit alcohol dehydrogenase family)
MRDVIVVIGPGQIGQAIARRVGVGKHVLLADLRQENADAAAEVLGNAGYEASVATVDVFSREAVHALVETATSLGDVTGLIHAAGVSPTQASPETILEVDLYGTALVLEEFGNVIARGGAGVVISSQSGHRLPPLTVEQNEALATTPAEELLGLPFFQPDQVRDSLHAYQLAKRGNSLRVMAEAVRWGERGARVNTISPGIVMTPLAKDELGGPRGAGYRRMIEVSAAGRAGTPDEVGAVGALLMGADGGFITGSDFLMDGGVTAAYWYGDLAEVRAAMSVQQAELAASTEFPPGGNEHLRRKRRTSDHRVRLPRTSVLRTSVNRTDLRVSGLAK